MKRKITLLFATGFGLGLSPFASGTTGSIPGVAIAFCMAGLDWPLQAVIAACLAIIAIPICDAAEKIYRKKDDGRIVADEYLTFPLCVIGLPVLQFPLLMGVAFVTNRILDIIKPPPAWQAQNIRGGIGIVLDDICSSLYALALNHMIYWILVRQGIIAT